MGAAPEFQKPISVEARCLTEVDNLNKYRQPDGSHSPAVSQDIKVNLITAVEEMAMPYRVSQTEHAFVGNGEYHEDGRPKGHIMWLGKTAVENAESGYAFHRLPAARERVDVEVEEARDSEDTLRSGVIKIFISPRMSRADASFAEARAEHLADDDSVRASWAIENDAGDIHARVMQSLLVRDIPLEAWVAMLQDPGNIFNKSITVANPSSALSIMRVHRELELSVGVLSEGVITVIAAAAKYIADPTARRSVEAQLVRFRHGQADMQAESESVAERWLEFETALADSLHTGYATKPIKVLINQMQASWSDEDLAVILAHQLPDAGYTMTRQLAQVVEQAKRYLLRNVAAIATHNEQVISQIHDKDLVRRVQASEYAALQGVRLQPQYEAEQDRQLANENTGGGGGCSGDISSKFKRHGAADSGESNGEATDSESQENWTIKKGTCRVTSCPSRPGQVDVGPCGVCMNRCQKLFDKGVDPTGLKDVAVKVADKLLSPLSKVRELWRAKTVGQEILKATQAETQQLAA